MAWWRSRIGRVRIPTLPKKDFDDDQRFVDRVADFLGQWSLARQQARETRTRPPSEPWLLGWKNQWRAVLALGDAETEVMTTIVIAITRWAYREGYRAGVRSGIRRRRRD